MRRLRQLFRDESGASAVEYGLIVVIAVGLALTVVYFFGHAFHNTRDGVTGAVDNPDRVYDGGAAQGGGVDSGFILRR